MLFAGNSSMHNDRVPGWNMAMQSVHMGATRPMLRTRGVADLAYANIVTTWARRLLKYWFLQIDGCGKRFPPVVAAWCVDAC